MCEKFKNKPSGAIKPWTYNPRASKNFMAQCDPEPSLADFFFKPLAECYPFSDSQYLCPELSDLDYLKLGVERCI